MGIKYRCPFCGKTMSKKEMQYHVGIPLCMKLRKKNTKTTKLVTMGGTIPVRELEFEYFGAKGLRDLMAYQLQRLTLGHPDDSKSIDMKSFVDHSEDDDDDG